MVELIKSLVRVDEPAVTVTAVGVAITLSYFVVYAAEMCLAVHP